MDRVCGSSSPNLPGRVAACPVILKPILVAQRVHGLPESIVDIGHELTIVRQALERFAFPKRIVGRNAVDDARIEDKETAVDVCIVARRFLREMRDLAAVKLQSPIASRGRHRSDGCLFSMGTMEG